MGTRIENSQKTKIVRIIARLNVGGPARHVVWLNEALQDDNCQSVLIAGRVPVGEEDMAYFADEHGVKPVFIEDMSRELSLDDLSALFRIWRQLAAIEPDIIHTHTAKAGTLGRVAGFMFKWLTPRTLIGRPKKVLVFHTFHGHIFHGYYGKLKTRVFLLIEKVLAKIATDQIIVISDEQAREIGTTYKIARPEKIKIVPLGLDLSFFDSDPDAGLQFRAEYGIGEDELLVGIVGRLTEIKNHHLFLDAARKLEMSSDFPRARFVIIGDGHLRRELESAANGTGILFAGNRTDPNEFYKALDIVVLTSLNEGTPLTLIEAMANGKAWIASMVGGVVDLAGPEIGSKFKVQGLKSPETESELGVQSSESGQAAPELQTRDPEPTKIRFCERGLLFDSGDADGLAEGLKILLADSDLRNQLGVNGKGFVNDNYTKERLIRDIRSLYGFQN